MAENENRKKGLNMSLITQLVILIVVFVVITAVGVNLNSIHKHKVEAVKMTQSYLEDLATESGSKITMMLNMFNSSSETTLTVVNDDVAFPEISEDSSFPDMTENKGNFSQGRPESGSSRGMNMEQMLSEISFQGYEIEVLLADADGTYTYDSDDSKTDTAVKIPEILELLDRAAEGTLAAKTSDTTEVEIDGKVYDFAYYVEDDGSIFGILLAQSEYLSEIQDFVISNSLVGAMIAIVCALVGAGVVYMLIRPFKEVERSLAKMGEFDFTRDPKEEKLCKYMGETGSIARTAMKLRTAFVEIVSGIDHNADTLKRIVGENAETCALVSDGTQETLALLENITANTDEASKRLEKCAELTSAIRTGMTDLRAGTEDIAKSSEKSTHDAGTTLSEATKSSKAVVENANAMEKLTNESIEELLKINEIENLTQTIKGIANQTNLLSLNASIEAARAGEAGRGFAVVADQIGKLSQDTGHAVTEIETVVEELEGTVDHVSEVLKQLITALKDSSHEDMEVIENLGNRFVDNCQSNLAAVEEISASSDSLEENCSNSATATNEVKDDVLVIAENLKGIAKNTQTNADAIEKVAESSRKIDEMAGELVSIVKKFKL